MPYDPMNQAHPGPTEPVDRIPADATQARTGNTQAEQDVWFEGVEEGQRRTEHNAAVRGQTDGWKLVPIQPTPKMIKAWHDIYSTAVVKTGRSSRAYEALIKAAPTPPASAQDDAKEAVMDAIAAAPNADDAPPHFTISASDRFELTGAVGLLRGYGCEGAADALQRTLDAEMASFSVQGEDAAGDARECDPLQGAANWLVQAHGRPSPTVLCRCLMIGYNRAQRLYDAAIAAQQGKRGAV